jgi:hypothetical protein
VISRDRQGVRRSPLRSTPWLTGSMHGQDSFLLRSSTVELAITSLGGMLAPVTFFPRDDVPIQPYHVAPWAHETLPSDTPPMLQALRGDWFCSAFGENALPHNGMRLPPHGETANQRWLPSAKGHTRAGCWIRLGVDLPLQGGFCESTTALLDGHSVVYQRHDLKGLTSSVNPGHHATLQFPATEGSGRLSFSPLREVRTYPACIDGPESARYSCLHPDMLIADLRAVPVRSGRATDLTRFPARSGFDDIVLLCADSTLEMAWNAVTFPDQGYTWFALRDPGKLASTLLWFSNGGRDFSPWNTRHRGVMGIEDVTAYFHAGIAASCESNPLSDRGIPTSLAPDARGRLSIPYIQGVARIPPDFSRVASLELGHERNTVRLQSDSGAVVEIPCHVEFLRTGVLPGLDFL